MSFTKEELGLSDKMVKEILKVTEPLQEQADYYDMEVDWETLTLVPKSKPKYDPYDYLKDEPELDWNDIND